MSIAFLADQSESNLTTQTLQDVAARLKIKISSPEDAADYLRLLQSLEAVMKHISQSSDYIHPALKPQAVVGDNDNSRRYWRPSEQDNPLNAWSHRCELVASKPTTDLLKGRTVVIKDNISVGGLPTTCGTFAELLSKDKTFPISPIDATVVARVLEAGATIKGTGTCENYCASPLSYSAASGPVHNAYLHGYTSGGSSSGCTSLIAAHTMKPRRYADMETCELGVGGDQAGSIRIPASYSGIYGLKPTHGLVPYTGGAQMSPILDHLGPLAANVDDIAVLLQVLAGYDGIDPRMTPESPLRTAVKNYPQILADFRHAASTTNNGHLGSGLRVGILKEAFETVGLSSEVRDTVLQSARAFFTAAGASVREVSIPMHLEGPAIWTAANRVSTSEWLCQGKTSGILNYMPPHLKPQWPPTQEMYELLTAFNPGLINIIFSGELLSHDGTGLFPADLEAKAHRKVFQLRAAYDQAFDDGVDVLITPCAPSVAMPHPDMRHSSVMQKLATAVGVTNNTSPFNATGHPAMSVPCGFGSAPHSSSLLPIGMQIVGRRWEDDMVIKAAAVFEEGRKVTAAEEEEEEGRRKVMPAGENMKDQNE